MWHGGLRSGVAEKMAPIRGFSAALKKARRSSAAAFRFAIYGPLTASDESGRREALRQSLVGKFATPGRRLPEMMAPPSASSIGSVRQRPGFNVGGFPRGVPNIAWLRCRSASRPLKEQITAALRLSRSQAARNVIGGRAFARNLG
jgi:hypothetical protein